MLYFICYKTNELGYKFRMSFLDNRSHTHGTEGMTNAQNGNGRKNGQQYFVDTWINITQINHYHVEWIKNNYNNNSIRWIIVNKLKKKTNITRKIRWTGHTGDFRFPRRNNHTCTLRNQLSDRIRTSLVRIDHSFCPILVADKYTLRWSFRKWRPTDSYTIYSPENRNNRFCRHRTADRSRWAYIDIGHRKGHIRNSTNRRSRKDMGRPRYYMRSLAKTWHLCKNLKSKRILYNRVKK